MRYFSLVAITGALLVGLGCNSDPVQDRRLREADESSFWGDLRYKPERVLGMEAPVTDPVVKKAPVMNQSAPIVQVGATGTEQ